MIDPEEEIFVVGRACRLPGASSIAALWTLLTEGRCAVTRVPEDRFPLARFGHPTPRTRGKSYTWSAGVIDDIWGFDPGVFGISPREAEQMDPQQRLLLQLSWEALEDAGIRPSSLAGTETGVYVGGSLIEYANAAYGDPAIVDSHFATGNALATLSNRISHAFDLRGPSLTIDTACSSSLVALHQACEALRAGRIDTAIVGGVNLIASHTSFVSFAQASMLSPTGLCRAFDGKADGFVRGEGGAVLVLRRAAGARSAVNPVRGVILASDVNSDGRTNGISLPSADAQEALLRRVYERSGIAPERLAFVEAHGTGTAVGDPIEAAALGRCLGAARGEPLPIGSIKTNIGHLEPASGLAGLLKALLALERRVLPPSLHFTEPNPAIDFQGLNLRVCDRPLHLADTGRPLAGVNSFGFGGTNAHVVVAPGGAAAEPRGAAGARFFMVSAATKPALAALAGEHAARLAGTTAGRVRETAAAAYHRRERFPHRAVMAIVEGRQVVRALAKLGGGEMDARLVVGEAVAPQARVAFVYTGNGSQWAGMGISAYRASEVFRQRFDEVDRLFAALSGRSLRADLFDADLGPRLAATSIAQPLLYAIQSAATGALVALGLRPAVVLGHSVGEVAAAEAAGLLSLADAVKIIHARSRHQEATRGAGGMAVAAASPERLERVLQLVPEIEVAAFNAPTVFTVAGPRAALSAFRASAAEHGVAVAPLDLEYAFHSAQMNPIRAGLIDDLRDVAERPPTATFISTVGGKALRRLGRDHWWRNIREPVHFAGAVREAARLGARVFVEIGPRANLLRHVAETLAGQPGRIATLAAPASRDDGGDPFPHAVAEALAAGAEVDEDRLFGPDPGPAVALPAYPWQTQPFRYAPTVEGLGVVEAGRHPLAGARPLADGGEWFGLIDTALLPALADHRLRDRPLLPGTGFVEMAFAAARRWLGDEQVAIGEFEIMKPLELDGETREVMTRISPAANLVEIFSRPRFSDAGWLQHCRGKVWRGAAPAPLPPPAAGGRVLAGDALYAIADGCGLNYGPAFRQVASLRLAGGGMTEVVLGPPAPAPAFLVDPVRVDCCIQGIIADFPALRAAERGVAYIPVRMGEASLVAAGVPQRSVLRLRAANERSLLADCDVLDADGRLLVTYRGVRCQAVPTRRPRSLAASALIERLVPVAGPLSGRTGVEVAPAALIDALDGEAAEDVAEDGAEDMLAGFAVAAAYEIARALARRGTIRPDRAVGAGVPERSRPWLASLLMGLQAAGLARREEGGVWRLARDRGMPAAAVMAGAIAAEFPRRAPELALAGAILDLAERLRRSKEIWPDAGQGPSAVTLAAFSASSVFAEAARRLLVGTLRGLRAAERRPRTLRVLQIGASPAPDALFGGEARDGFDVTVVEPAGDRPDAAKELGGFDLIVTVGGLNALAADFALGRMTEWLEPGGMILAIEREPSFFHDLVLGLQPGWFEPGAAEFPISRLRDGGEWRRAFEAAGLPVPATRAVRLGGDPATLIVARKASAPAAAAGSNLAAMNLLPGLLGAANTPLGRALADRVGGPRDGGAAGGPWVAVVEDDDGGDAAEAVAARCLGMKAAAESLQGTGGTLWLAFRGATPASGEPARPVAAAGWDFSRTLANEVRGLDIRRIDVAAGLGPESGAAAIAAIVASGTSETELAVSADGVGVLRVLPLGSVPPATERRAPVATLRRVAGSGSRQSWGPAVAAAPGPGEVEIAVEATGLNFRDVMQTLALLPDDVLEGGFAGATLGLECAGRVARLGPGVDDLAVGDRVVAIAAAAFSTSVTVPRGQVAPIADRVASEAATTLPVAFLTAHYGLVELARLRRGETVLIHGAAGGVGMAAMQVALARGAIIFASAGTPSRRALVRALGARQVFDSRGSEFAEAVREASGGGVDVVLNSLSGEAMERSVACLREFGRFVELGKRDYVANTHLGLRPFRNNLSYFGADIDQLVTARPGLARRLFAEVMRRFERGVYRPLPYTLFEAGRVGEAFQAMQQSAQVGKIVVRPPGPEAMPAAATPFVIDPGGTHLVTGGLGGFGLETAKWLADRGARHLALVGRNGPRTPEARAVVEALAARGVNLFCEPCDVSDRRALAGLLERMKAAMPPLAGVVHEAMVLEDGLIESLDADRLERVLAPKVRGADNLDILTRDVRLDYFILFSSVTTLIGNPGQGAYVAANGYLEGLARRRRQQGLPGLAVGWGPIADVGVVARSDVLRERLAAVAGARAFTAREGLDLMAQALELDGGLPESAALTLADLDGGFTAAGLAVLRSPTYRELVGRGGQVEAGGGGRIDVRALLAAGNPASVHQTVGDAILAEVARVLHAQPDEIGRSQRLGELGLDSLMALELAMAIEQRFDAQLSLRAAAGELSVASLADQIIAQAGQRRSEAVAVAAPVAAAHTAAIDAAELEALGELLQGAPEGEAEDAA